MMNVSLAHIDSKQYLDVYEPSDDSYLLVDALQNEVAKPNSVFSLPQLVCLEIGCGSGYVSTSLALQLRAVCSEPRQHLFLLTDVNVKAANVARQTMSLNKVNNFEVIVSDLTANLLPRLEKKVDVLIFNPPYVPSEQDEMLGDGISRSWAGGENGREILDLLIPDVDKLLSSNGCFYVVAIMENKPKEIEKAMNSYGFKGKMIAKKRAKNEFLMILKFWRKK